MNRVLLVVLLTFLAGCAAPVRVDSKILTNKTRALTKKEEISYVLLPSHGAIADAMSTASAGGSHATQLKAHLRMLSTPQGEQVVLVTSNNPALANAAIQGAVKGGSFPGVWLVYAGDAKYADSLRALVEAAGMRYGFIDARK